jgi:hypothetical protein
MDLYYGTIVGICSTYRYGAPINHWCSCELFYFFIFSDLHFFSNDNDSPLYASIITLYDHFIHMCQSPYPQQFPVGKVGVSLGQEQQQDDTMKDVTSALLSPLQMMQLSTVSSSSSLSSAATTKDKDL